MEKRLSPEEACRLVREELGFDRSCVRACFDEDDSRVCCLVGTKLVWRDLSWNVFKANNILTFLFNTLL